MVINRIDDTCECCGEEKSYDQNQLCQSCYIVIDDDMIGMHWELFFKNREGDWYE